MFTKKLFLSGKLQILRRSQRSFECCSTLLTLGDHVITTVTIWSRGINCWKVTNSDSKRYHQFLTCSNCQNIFMSCVWDIVKELNEFAMIFAQVLWYYGYIGVIWMIDVIQRLNKTELKLIWIIWYDSNNDCQYTCVNNINTQYILFASMYDYCIKKWLLLVSSCMFVFYNFAMMMSARIVT